MSKKLLQELKRYNIRQTEICKATGLSTSMVCRYFKGVKQQNPYHGELILNNAKALIEAAKIKVAELVKK